MINAIRLIAPVILTSFMLVSANTKRDNHFLGKWEIDIQKTLTSNDLPSGNRNSLNINPSDHVINFGLAGNYSERFGGLKFKGSWSRYDTDLAIARLESDDRIKNIKKHLNQKIKQGKLPTSLPSRVKSNLIEFINYTISTFKCLQLSSISGSFRI